MRCGIPFGDVFKNMYIGFAQRSDQLEFVEMRDRNTFPRGEGAPVRNLGRMRNGDLFQICLQFG